MQLSQLSFHKVDDFTKMPLSGAVFELRGTNYYKMVTSNEDGLVVFQNLNAGKYFFREIESPAGYLLEKESLVVTVDFEGKVYLNSHPAHNIIIGNINADNDALAVDNTVSCGKTAINSKNIEI